MHILVINAGSSSVKFTLFKGRDLTVSASGMVERIGQENTFLKFTTEKGAKRQEQTAVSGTADAVHEIADFLTHKSHGVLKSLDEISAVGHRVVHGGEKVVRPVMIDDAVKKVIRACYELAPLHNPPNMKGIKACETFFPKAIQVAVFDTAFHATINDHAYLYGLPYAFYEKYGIRRYGFHGTSHQYVSKMAAKHLEKPLKDLKVVTCHLGNGCSITAVDRGKSTDTSMGFTPLEGVMMGTRCGDIDPAIIFFLLEHVDNDPDAIKELLNKKSGLYGLADIGSGDLRDVLKQSEKENPKAKAAIKAYAYRIKKYIGAYIFAMGGADAVVFTAGIGENAHGSRKMVCHGLENLGIAIDDEKNRSADKPVREIQDEKSAVKILVICTNEELEIASQTLDLVSSGD